MTSKETTTRATENVAECPRLPASARGQDPRSSDGACENAVRSGDKTATRAFAKP
jgi:hypothetical protein